MGSAGKRRYTLWPSVTPKKFEVDRPASEFIREWASMTPQGAALKFYGKEITYKDAGVDLGLGDEASEILYNAAKLTWKNREGNLWR